MPISSQAAMTAFLRFLSYNQTVTLFRTERVAIPSLLRFSSTPRVLSWLQFSPARSQLRYTLSLMRWPRSTSGTANAVALTAIAKIPGAAISSGGESVLSCLKGRRRAKEESGVWVSMIT